VKRSRHRVHAFGQLSAHHGSGVGKRPPLPEEHGCRNDRAGATLACLAVHHHDVSRVCLQPAVQGNDYRPEQVEWRRVVVGKAHIHHPVLERGLIVWSL
jgi:hypothetical protein